MILHRYRRYIAAFLVALTLLAVIPKARAFVDETGAYAALLATPAVAAAGSAMITASGTVLGLTPIGWGAVGLALLAATLVSSDSTHKLVVSTRTSDKDPNPDLAVPRSAPSSAAPGLRYFANTSYQSSSEYFSLGFSSAEAMGQHLADINTCFTGGSITSHCSSGNATAWNALTPASRYSAVQAWVAAGKPMAPNQTRFGFSRLVQDGTFGNAPRYALYLNSYPSPTSSVATEYRAGGAGYYIFTELTCPTDSVLDETNGACYTVPTSLRDGFCRVSFDPVTGCPASNPLDPDCSYFSIQSSCGNTTTPPTVTAVDPVTGKKLTTSRPSLPAQGSPGSISVSEETPDPSNNTTVKKMTHATPDPANPSAPPKTSGSSQEIKPGTGSSVGTAPVSKVEVTNWPKSNSSGPTVNFPDKLKVDGEVPADASDLPTPPPDTPDAKTFLDPVKSRLASFVSFTLPPHTSQCPAIAVDFEAWGPRFSVSSNFMCEQLEKNKALMQALCNFLYLAAAIRIVLRA